MKLTDGEPIGILRGPSGHGGMDVVAPYLADPPARGDFALVPGRDGTLVLRIAGSFATGSFGESSDRGAEYLAQLALGDAEVPARIRELLLRFRIEVVPLGWLRDGGQFEAGVRHLQLFGHPVYRPSVEALRALVNVGLRADDPSRVRLGVLSRGHETVRDVEVQFSIERLKGQRTFVFARAGYGKSNLVKLLLSRLYASPPDVGLLIVDPEGEYAFPSGNTPGLADHPDIRGRLRVYTERDPSQFRAAVRTSIAGRVKPDLARLTPTAFLGAFVPEEKQQQVWANWLRMGRERGWASLVEVLRKKGYGARDEEILGALGIRPPGKDKEKDGNVSVQAIRNNVIPVLERLDGQADLAAEVCHHLVRNAGVVVLDVSCMPAHDADAIVRLLLQRLFHDRVEAYTAGAAAGKGVLLLMEEAQSVLGGADLDDQDIYVRWVKEGRKYGLGAMMVTQQPGAISPNLVSQGDNFFAMHLLAERDLRVLGQSNAHFTPEILGFLRDEPVKGNCYFWSAPDQPYVVGTRVDNYDEQARAIEPEAPATDGYEDRLSAALVRAVAEARTVYLFRVRAVDGRPVEGLLAAAPFYLAQNVPGAVELQRLRPDDWEGRDDRPVLRSSALQRGLQAARLWRAPGRAWGVVTGRERDLVLLDATRLAELAQAEGVRVKALADDGVEVRSGG